MLRRPNNRPAGQDYYDQEESASTSSSGWRSNLNYLRYVAFIGIFITVVIVLVIVNQDRAILSDFEDNQDSIPQRLENVELDTLDSDTDLDEVHDNVNIDSNGYNLPNSAIDQLDSEEIQESDNLPGSNKPIESENLLSQDQNEKSDVKASSSEQTEAEYDDELVAAIDKLIDNEQQHETNHSSIDLGSDFNGSVASAAIVHSINQTMTVDHVDVNADGNSQTNSGPSNLQTDIELIQESDDDAAQVNPDSIRIRLIGKTANHAEGILPNPRNIRNLSGNITQ